MASSGRQMPTGGAARTQTPPACNKTFAMQLPSSCVYDGDVLDRRFRSEFVMWAAEVQKVDVEGLPKWEEKELFKCACGLCFSMQHRPLSGHVAGS